MTDSVATTWLARRSLAFRWGPVVAFGALAFAAMAVVSTRYGLNGDVLYVIGGHLAAVGPDGAPAGVDAFTHRPLVYRAFLAALTGLVGIAGLSPANPHSFEAALRLVAIGLAGLAGGALVAALRPRVGERAAVATGVTVGGVLAFAPAWNLLQAEWLGALLAVLAVSAALVPRRPWVGGALAGAVLVAAAGAKLSTAPYGAIAFLVIAAFAPARRLPVVVSGIGAAGAFGALLLVVPHELQWMTDTATLSAGSPLEALRDWKGLTSAIVSEAAVAPVVMLAPAALAVLVRGSTGRTRWWLVGGAVLLLALAILPLPLQRASYLYRLSMLPVVCAGIVGLAAADLLTNASGRWFIVAATAVVSAAASIVLSLPTAARAEWTTGLIAFVVGVSAVIGVAAWWVAGRDSRNDAIRPFPAAGPAAHAPLAAFAVAALALPTLLPTAAWALDPAITSYRNATWAEQLEEDRAEAGVLAEAIRPGERVLYLAYGSVAYHLGNPTPCRYPSPAFLRLGVGREPVRRTTSYAENLACFTDAPADWLLVQPAWLTPGQLPDPAAGRILQRFDCERAVKTEDFQACPSRGRSADSP